MPGSGSSSFRRFDPNLVPLLLGAVYAAATTVFFIGFVPEPGSFADPQAFAAAFRRTSRLGSALLFPLGTVSVIANVAALVLSGGFGSWRARTRLVAILALVVSGVLSMTLGEDIEAAVVTAATGDPTSLGEAVAQATAFRTWTVGLAMVHICALVVAHRLPLPATRRSIAPELDAHHRLLLLLLGVATLFEGYDRFIVSLALPYIGEDLGASEATLGFALAAIRVGALGSIFLGRLADRHGRRRLLLLTILAYTLATAATGLSRGIDEFVICQFFANVFLLTELSLAQVVVAEEFPANFRAKGQAILGAFAAFGAGMAALLFPLLQATPLGWRGLYFVGILPLLLVAFLRRTLPETKRWQKAREGGALETARVRDLLSPGLRPRFLALSLLAAVISGSAAAAFSFASYRATRSFGWEPAQVSTMIIVAGSLGLAGWWVFGALAERVGRRFVGVVSCLGIGIAISVYFQTSFLRTGFAILVFMEAGAMLSMMALGTELFPTTVRSTAKAWLTAMGFVGAMLAFGVVGFLSGTIDGAANAITLIGLLPAVCSPVMFLLPETRGTELEDLTPAAVI